MENKGFTKINLILDFGFLFGILAFGFSSGGVKNVFTELDSLVVDKIARVDKVTTNFKEGLASLSSIVQAEPLRTEPPSKIETVKNDLAKNNIVKTVQKVVNLERVVEVERITKIEPIREIVTEKIITKIDDESLKYVRSQILDLQTELGKRLYAPGGVVSQQIYVTQPVSSPKIYQENGDIVLQTLGSGNVLLTAATGLNISGKQVIIDSTASANPQVFINDKLRVDGQTDVLGPITAQKITLNNSSGNGRALDIQIDGVTKFAVENSGATTFAGEPTFTGNITATGTLSVHGTSTLAINSGGLAVGTTTLTGLLNVGTTTSGLSINTAGNTTLGGNLDLSNKIITNIGNAGTDFDSAGGLTLAGPFKIDSQGNSYILSNLSLGTTSAPFGNLEITSASTSNASSSLTITVSTSTNIYDPQLVFRTGAAPTTKFLLGVDYSDSNKFKIATSTLGTNDLLSIDFTTGNLALATTATSSLFKIATTTEIFNVLTSRGVGIGTSTVAGLLNVGTTSSGLFVDNKGFVGIGTTGPAVRLDISSGNIRLSDSQNIQWGGTTNFLTGSNASNFLAFNTNNTERIRIDSSGSVGIGTTSPAYGLELKASTTAGYLGISNRDTRGGDVFQIDGSGNIGVGTSTAPFGTLEITNSNRANASTSLTITVSTSTNIYDPQLVFRTGAAPTTKFLLGVDYSGPNMFVIATSTPGTNDLFAIDYMTGGVSVATTSTSTLNLFTVGTTTEVFNVFSTGGVGIGTSTMQAGYKLIIRGGALCVDDTAANSCPAAPTSGAIYVENSVGTGNVSAFDIAEYYPASQEVEKGDIIIVDPLTISGQVKKSDQAYQKSIIGVVSTDPAIVMSESNISFGKNLGDSFDPLKPYVVLAGRAPVKVSLENGEIQPGDSLTSSSLPGTAMKATSQGMVIGTALEPYDGSNPEGKIMVFISPRWQGNDLSVEQNDAGQIVQIDIKSELASLGLVVSENGVLEVGTLKTKKVFTEELEMKDKATGEIWCTWIENGEWQKSLGECGNIDANDTNSDPNAANNETANTEVMTPGVTEPAPDLEPNPEPVSETLTVEITQ